MAAERELSAVRVHREPLALAALVANLAIVLPLAYILNIWQDEAYTLQTTSRDLGYAFHQAIGFEQNAPLYFLLVTLWRHASDAVFFLRLPSVLSVAGAIALVPALARRYIPQVDSGLVTVVVALNPFVIWAALEMRVYALIVLIAALLLLTFFDAFFSQEPSKASSVAYTLCVIAALYTQYYLGFLIAAQGLTLLLYRPRAFIRFVLCGAVAALAFAPMLGIVPGEVHNFESAFTRPSLLRSVVVLAGILARYALPLPVAHAKAVYLVIAVGAGLATLAFRKLFEAGENRPILVTAALAFVLFAVGTYAAGVHVLDRHAASLFLPVVLSVFAALSFLRTPLRKRAILVWACLAIAGSVASLVQTYAPLAKPGDWIRATAYIRKHERPNQPIVVFEAENALPFAYYYDGPNRIVAIPHPVDFTRYDVTRFVIDSQRELGGVMPRAPQLWLVTAGECRSANIAFGCEPLERFIERHYRVESSAGFYGSRVRLLRADRT